MIIAFITVLCHKMLQDITFERSAEDQIQFQMSLYSIKDVRCSNYCNLNLFQSLEFTLFSR